MLLKIPKCFHCLRCLFLNPKLLSEKLHSHITLTYPFIVSLPHSLDLLGFLQRVNYHKAVVLGKFYYSASNRVEFDEQSRVSLP